jgi:hypothetical protein
MASLLIVAIGLHFIITLGFKSFGIGFIVLGLLGVLINLAFLLLRLRK